MFNRGPNLIIHTLVSALGGAVALSAGITGGPGLSAAEGWGRGAGYAVDALSVLIVAALVGDRRVRAAIKRFASDDPLIALRGLAKSWLRYPRAATAVFRARNRHFRT